MFRQSRKISHALVLLALALSFNHASGRSVSPVTYGYELGTPKGDAAVPEDLTIAAAEPRPVVIELVKQPQSLPLVAEPASAESAASAPASSASVKVEKVLRKPMAFSMNTDQTHAASHLILNSPKEKLQGVESKHGLDQQPQAIDYYKYIARLQDEKDSGAGLKKDQDKNEESASEKKEVAENKDSSDLRVKSKPHIFLRHSPSHYYSEYIKPSGFHKSEEKSEGKDDHYHHDDVGGKADASESHEDHQADQEHGQENSGEESQKEEVQENEASASSHGGGGVDGNYKKGGGKEYVTVNEGEHGEVGQKKYEGHHHHERGEKGHKDKEDNINEYEEKIGHKNGHHEEDGYESEHQHGEEGKRGTQFHEEGEHSKGHSTQGEHNIHKKDEYEKKQEFYDESHEGGEHEKHGEYFHEDDYNKGGHHKSGHREGGHHGEQYGKQKEFEEGGHEHKDNGHQKAIGREVHHDHAQKGGEEASNHGGKRWSYQQGSGGGDDNKGAHQQQVQVVVKDGSAQASSHGNVEDQIYELTMGGKQSEPAEAGDNGHVVEATELHKKVIEEFNFSGINIDGAQNAEATQQHPVRDAAQGQGSQGEASNYGYLLGASSQQEPAKTPENNYGADANAYLALQLAHSESHPPHVLENGEIREGSPSTPVAAVQPAVSTYQGEESAPNSHILVVGNDGNIYGLLTNDGIINAAV